MDGARGRVPGWARQALAVVIALVWLAPSFVGPATATDRGLRPDGSFEVAQLFEEPFFRRLFGNDEPAREPSGGPKIFRVPAPDDGVPGVRRQQAPAQAAPTAPKRIKVPEPAATVTPKDPDAKRVLVVGDSFAASVASGLEIAFADKPGVVIVDASDDAAGLTGGDGPDVAARVRENLAGEAPADAVVVMLGYGDRGPLTVDGQSMEFRTEAWEAVYRARVRAVISAAREAQVPVYWVGLMPAANLEVTTDIAYLDEIYRQEAGPLFAVYVDVWNAFTDDVGGVLRSGPDVTGQVRQLRLKDGVGFTKSGSRKLAFYVEQEIRGWLERGAPATVLPQVPGAGLVLSLNDPEAGPEEELAGGEGTAAPKSGTPLYDLVVLGQPLPPRSGRVDDLRTVR